MNRLLTLTTICFFYIYFCLIGKVSAQESDSPKILMYLPDKLGANFNLNIDDLEAYGLDVMYSGLTEVVNTCSWSVPLGNISLEVDTLFVDIEDVTIFDAIAIQPASWRGGIAYGDLINHSTFLDQLKTAKENNLSIWATCTGVRVLAKAEILEGVNVTGKENYDYEYIDAGAIYHGPGILPIIDQHIITSTRGMYFHFENSEALVRDLEQSSKKAPVKKQQEIISQKGKLASTNTIWSHSYGGTNADGGKEVIQTRDGGFAIAGYTWSSGNGKSDMLLTKTNQHGEMQWSKTFGGQGWEYAYAIEELSAGGFVLAGYTSSGENSDRDFYIVKTDEEGNELWTKSVGGNKLDVANDIVETSDGNLLVFGYTESFLVEENDFYLVKIDMEGNEVWTKNYGGEAAEIGWKIMENHNNEIMLLGSTGSFGAGNRDIYLVCVNQSGEEIWSQTYGTASYNCGFDMVEINKSGYAIVGHSDVHGSELLDIEYIRTDSIGNALQSKRFESDHQFYDYGKSIFQTSQGYIAICGIAKVKDTRQNDVYFLLIDEHADIVWQELVDAGGSEWVTSAIESKDGNFIVAGQTNGFGAGTYDSYLLKLTNPYVSINSTVPQEDNLAPAVPNPVRYYTDIQFNVSQDERVNLAILDNSGKAIKSFKEFNTGEHKLRWNCLTDQKTKVQSGIYHIVMQSNSKVQSQKIVVL